jgi:hypothetical protein
MKNGDAPGARRFILLSSFCILHFLEVKRLAAVGSNPTLPPSPRLPAFAADPSSAAAALPLRRVEAAASAE